MTGQTTTKVRRVKCPRCRLLLEEPTDIPLYKCGGCGTVLQAKIRKTDTRDAGPLLHKTNPAQKIVLEDSSEDKETGIQKENLSSSRASALGESTDKDQNGHENCIREQPGFSNGFSSSTELTCHEHEESSPEPPRADMEVDEECYLDQIDGRDQNQSGDCNKEHGGINLLNEVSSSTELNGNENDRSSQASGAHIGADENRFSLEQINKRSQKEFGNCNGALPGDMNSSHEVSSSPELTCHEIEEQSTTAGDDDNFKIRFIFKSSSDENLLEPRPRDSTITAQGPLGESISSDNLTSPDNEQLELSQKSVVHGFDCASSLNKLEDASPVDPSSELNVTLGDMPRSPTTRSYYAYDGSVSSYDGTDDQVPDWNLRRNLKDADLASGGGMPVRDEYMVNTMVRSDSETNHHARNSISSFSSEKQHYAIKDSKWHQDEVIEPTRYGHPVRSRMGLESGELLPRLPFHLRSSHTGYEQGSTSGYGHNEFQQGTSFHTPDKSEYPEQEKMALLRMIYELQDQINKTNISKGKENGTLAAGAVMKEKQICCRYDHIAPEVEICRDLNYPRYFGRCSQGQCWSQHCKYPCVHFSGEVTKSRHQIDCSSSHCYPPQEWHCSTQLPLRAVCCSKGCCTAHSSHTCYNIYCSGSLSPQHHTGSEFSSHSHDMKSDDQRHKGYGVKKSNLRERHHLMKRHFRPMAGGSPFITCYRCWELLQLPADFLVFGRTCHRLRCSACSTVLKFSLQNQTHIVPYAPDSVAPPPSEVDDIGEPIDRRTLASASYANANDCSHADPVSFSDDYGPSFCRSCSTEVEPSSLTPPFYTLEKNPNYRKMSSGSSFGPMEEREWRMSMESRNKHSNSGETLELAGPSSKFSKSSEIEELPPRTGSPLHRLMGYSSPSEVLKN